MNLAAALSKALAFNRLTAYQIDAIAAVTVMR